MGSTISTLSILLHSYTLKHIERGKYNSHSYRAHKCCKKHSFMSVSTISHSSVCILHQRYVNMSCNIIETNTAIETFKMFIKKTGKFYFYIKKLQKNRIRKKAVSFRSESKQNQILQPRKDFYTDLNFTFAK